MKKVELTKEDIEKVDFTENRKCYVSNALNRIYAPFKVTKPGYQSYELMNDDRSFINLSLSIEAQSLALDHADNKPPSVDHFFIEDESV